jgi:hypothetical protein
MFNLLHSKAFDISTNLNMFSTQPQKRLIQLNIFFDYKRVTVNHDMSIIFIKEA